MWFGDFLPPLYSLIASDNASIDSMSKLLVGSSWKKETRQVSCRTNSAMLIKESTFLPRSEHQADDTTVQQTPLWPSDHLLEIISRHGVSKCHRQGICQDKSDCWCSHRRVWKSEWCERGSPDQNVPDTSCHPGRGGWSSSSGTLWLSPPYSADQHTAGWRSPLSVDTRHQFTFLHVNIKKTNTLQLSKAKRFLSTLKWTGQLSTID